MSGFLDHPITSFSQCLSMPKVPINIKTGRLRFQILQKTYKALFFHILNNLLFVLIYNLFFLNFLFSLNSLYFLFLLFLKIDKTIFTYSLQWSLVCYYDFFLQVVIKSWEYFFGLMVAGFFFIFKHRLYVATHQGFPWWV